MYLLWMNNHSHHHNMRKEYTNAIANEILAMQEGMQVPTASAKDAQASVLIASTISLITVFAIIAFTTMS
jgi:hypothetical protein